MMRPIQGERGMFTAEQVRAAIRPMSFRHAPRLRLLEVENTSNLGGAVAARGDPGGVGPGLVAREHDLACHMDGARLMNAVVASGVPAADYAAPFNSVWIDFSKGLGRRSAPCPPARATSSTRRGGSNSRSAAPCARPGSSPPPARTPSITTSSDWPKTTPTRAIWPRAGRGIPGIELDPATVETNIVWFDVRARMSGFELAAALKERGVLIGAFGPTRMRAVTHLDVDRAGIDAAPRSSARPALNVGRPGACRWCQVHPICQKDVAGDGRWRLPLPARHLTVPEG